MRGLSSSIVFTVLLFGMAAPAPLVGQQIAVGDYQLEVHRSGSGSPMILLESGALSGAGGWDPIVESVSALGTVIRYSRPGEGETEGPGKQLSAAQFADLAAGLLDALEVSEPVVVVGHSYGGRVAKYLAARHPDRVAAMLLLDPAHAGDVDVMRQIDRERADREITRIEQQDRQSVPNWPALDDIWAKQPAPGFEEIGDLPVTLIVSVKRSEDPPNLLASDAGRVGWAMLHSGWTAEFPRGRLVLTDRAGHFVQVDEPQLVLRELRALIERLTPSP